MFVADAESHILFFDIEGLIFELHSEEYAAMSPTTLEVSEIDWVCPFATELGKRIENCIFMPLLFQ